MATIVKVSRDFPTDRTTVRKLKTAVVASQGHNRFKELGGGRYLFLKRELGFMESIYHVALYIENPGLFQKDRLQIIANKSFENIEDALTLFERVN